MSREPTAGLILAAGKGTRMKSEIPKALHPVAGMPMVELVSRAVRGAGIPRPTVVVGHGGDAVIEGLGDGYDFVWQREQRGTGHAVMMAAEAIRHHHGPLLVTPGDTPLLSSETLARLIEAYHAESAQVSMATFVTVEPGGYGRIVRDAEGQVAQIVEDRDATPQQKALLEVNPAVYCFDCQLLLEVIQGLDSNNAQGEVYLTDAIAAIHSRGGKIVAETFDDPDEFMGVNDRWQLAEASRILRLRILRKHAMNGVTIVDPSSSYITMDVEIEPDALIEPMTVIEGNTRIAAGARIGPNAWVKDSEIGQDCRVFMSHVDQATMADGSRCGPFSNLRPGTCLGEGVKIGNFVEVKNSEIGPGTAISHLTYIGDATVGSGANIGAGTITCNYDGFAKHRTKIGDGAFIGSNSTLVAPVEIGDNGFVAAGSVITKGVPEGALGVGRARQEVREGWVNSWKAKKSSPE